jgi:hypothetical protein
MLQPPEPGALQNPAGSERAFCSKIFSLERLSQNFSFWESNLKFRSFVRL